MSYYAIGIGGTGAKCLEALIHLSAAGLMPEPTKNLHLLFVDSDRENGNGTRAGELLSCYQSCNLDGAGFFKTKIPSLQDTGQAAASNHWSPTKTNEELNNFVSRTRLDDNFRHLFNTLFTEEEAITNLNKGFRGRPSIGSVVMANAVDLEKTEPWKSLQTKMKVDNGGSGGVPKVMIFGSIFGGTGAAGVPTIARILRNWTNSIKDFPLQIGGVLCLPYFSFDDSGFGNELHVKSENLVLNTQAALKYYHQQNFHENIDVTYLLGADDQRQMPVASTGSTDQKNPAHWIELFAALAAVDFYQSDNTKRSPYQLLARQSSGNLLWSDLPERDAVQSKLLHLARFSFAFLSEYYPRLLELKRNQRTHRATWYVHFFEKKNVDLTNAFDNELKFVKQFCEKFLFWFANIQFSVYGADGGAKNLIDYSSFAHLHSGDFDLKGTVSNNEFIPNFDRAGFANIGDSVKNLDSLLKKMNEASPSKETDNTAWSFINELYRNCA